jgi:formylglycine-generating enzyme required for sulfatase activity
MKIRRFFSTIAIVAILVCVGISCKKPVTSVTLDKTTLTLTKGETKTLIVNVQPDKAANKSVKWESNNPAVATVMSNGLITAISKGTATIVVSTEDGGKTASCVVTVILPPHPAEPELVFVEGGTFTMGCTDGDCFPEREYPAHQVTLSNFKIAKYLETQKQWVSIMGNNPSSIKGDNLPVTNINWYDIQEFILRLNDSTEKQYRLATEAEWEFAARGGNKGVANNYKYSGSNDVDAVAWYDGNSKGVLNPVGTKAPNELGIYDMSGCLWEWCNDWYEPYTASPKTNTQGAATGTVRVQRGGSYDNNAPCVRVAWRSNLNPNDRAYSVGFRLAHP